MSSALYKLYEKDIYKLAKTLVIKSRYIAEAVNNALLERGVEVLFEAPSTWKYYKNLAGEYHNTDLPYMRVTSMDTQEEIDFTKENLLIHKATAREYAYGTTYHKQLVKKYPTKKRLIFGILNPVDINDAVVAKEGTILFYDPKLVEPNELNLIPELQRFITRYIERWVTPDYRFSHDLYTGGWFAALCLNIPQTIFNIRFGNCHTDFVHSFHIRQYLASHGRLDRYMETLTKKQQLFLYRNIRYITTHAGKQSTFKLLIQRLITERRYPLGRYTLLHNTANLPTQLKPDIELLLEPINTPRSFGYSNSYTVKEVLEKENPDARDNAKNIDYHETLVTEKSQDGPFGKYPTKVLESSVDDISNNSVRTLTEMLLHHWMYLSSHNLYSAVTYFTHPATGERVLISAKDAFVLYMYCKAKTVGMTLTTIPTLNAHFVRLANVPSLATLQKIVDRRYVNDTTLNQVLANTEDLTRIVSVDDFYETIVSFHERLRLHYYQWANETAKIKQGMLKAAAMRLYGVVPCEFYVNRTYSNWFNDIGITLGTLTRFDYDAIANELYLNASGVSLNTTLTLRQIHTATIDLMRQLSSYSVQYVATINTENVLRIGTPEVLVGNIETTIGAGISAPIPRAEILGISFKPTYELQYDLGGFDDLRIKTSTHTRTTVLPSMKNSVFTNHRSKLRMPVTIVGIKNITFT
jgi:hypothetical protein